MAGDTGSPESRVMLKNQFGVMPDSECMPTADAKAQANVRNANDSQAGKFTTEACPAPAKAPAMPLYIPPI